MMLYYIYILLLKSSLLLVVFLNSMSLYYQVMGAARCPRIKKHSGIKLRPLPKAPKEPFVPGDMLIYSCESNDFTQTIKCLDDGRWSDIPHCPDPSNSTCPDIGPILHGTYNASAPFKVGTVVAFKCDEETPGGDNTTTTTPAVPPIKYNITGPRLLKCLPTSKWSFAPPTCSKILPTPASNVSLMLTSALLILIPILIFIAVVQLLIRWRKRQQQRARWKQYFTDYKYRHSKTSITFVPRPQSSNTTIPVTDL